MGSDTPAYCGSDALLELLEYCRSRQLNRFLLVADTNTYDALGRRAECSLRERGWDVRTVILSGRELLADEQRVFKVLLHAGGEARTYVAAGSGTITDITRYASYCARNPFISLPTAPSVDAYESNGAALVVGGFKLTVPAQPPVAVYADLETLCAAPRRMIAAGFGDMLGKYTALADWKLAELIVDESYSESIEERARRALETCVTHSRAIGRAEPTGIEKLMHGLLESGRCMADAGMSRPASGSEHLLSHFWEMKLLQENRPAMLHGAKVGVGTVLAAKRYEIIRGLTRGEVVSRLASASLPSVEDETRRIRTAYGPLADRIITGQQPYLEMLEENFDKLRQRVLDRWPQIRTVAATVPPAKRIADLLEQAGAPSSYQALGLSDGDVEEALEFSRYIRSRFTVNTLGRVLGLW